MKTRARFLSSLLLLLLVAGGRGLAQQPSPTEDLNMMPDQVTTLLKEHWTFLRDATDAFLKTIEKKGDFETTEEFQARVEREKNAYIAKVSAHIKEAKLDKRLFGVLLKASLKSYDADARIYTVASPTFVQLPYDIPTLICQIPPNPYVAMDDTIEGGYRTSRMYLKFSPDFLWKTSRDVAMGAKQDQEGVFFKIRFRIDLSQVGFTDKAIIRIIPQDVLLVNQNKRLLYWSHRL